MFQEANNESFDEAVASPIISRERTKDDLCEMRHPSEALMAVSRVVEIR